MRVFTVFPLLFSLAATPLDAQRGCRTDARPPRPEDAEKHAIRTAIRDTLRRELVAGAQEAGIAEPAGLVVIRRGRRADDDVEATILRGNVPNSLVASVLAPRVPLAAQWPDTTLTFSVRLDGPLPPSGGAECLPAVRNGPEFARELGRIFAAERDAPRSHPRLRMTLRMLVSREGDVVYVEVSRREPGMLREQQVLQAARRLRFRPASVGGVPVDVWVDQPVHF